MACEHCTSIGIPLRLCSDDKPEPLEFISKELIFRRHNQLGNEESLKNLSENEIGAKIFHLNSDSYNRSSLSEPEDVLLNEFPSVTKPINYYTDYGIIALPIDQINGIEAKKFYINNVECECKLKVVHSVTPCNYSHAEIFLYINNRKWDEKAPKTVKPFFRRELQKMLLLIKQFSDVVI